MILYYQNTVTIIRREIAKAKKFLCIQYHIVTFRDLQKLVQSQSDPEQSQLLRRLRDKPFWIWDQSKHREEDIKTKGDCCFNHIVGLPKKDNQEKPMFEYERLLYDFLLISDFYNPLQHTFKLKHLWVKKATGLGVTEFFLRFMAWLCLKDDSYRNSQMCIVTGPNQDIAIKLIKRMKGLFEPKLGVTFANKETVLELNGCSIEAYPSNHLDAYRALDNPKFILLDEADFFRKSEQVDVRHVSERYIAKSDPFIVMVSTPYAPDGLFDSIEKEPEETCIYKRILLDYTYGLDKIYTREEIEKAKISPNFEREYNLKYLGGIGNVFHTKDIDAAIEKGKIYDPANPVAMSPKSMGIDPAYGPSSYSLNQERDSLMMKAETLDLEILTQNETRTERIFLSKNQYQVLDVIARALDQTIAEYITDTLLSMMECELKRHFSQTERKI